MRRACVGRVSLTYLADAVSVFEPENVSTLVHVGHLLHPDNIPVKLIANEVKVREDERLTDVETTRDDVFAILFAEVVRLLDGQVVLHQNLRMKRC